MGSPSIQSRITAMEALALVYETSLTALATAGVESYTLDTGLSRQTVTKQDISKIQAAYKSTLNLIDVLYARLNGCGTIRVGPSW